MFKLSTYFIKGQIPGIAKSDIIQFYKKELNRQSVNNISFDDDTIRFNNNSLRFVPDRFANKFSSFSSGEIKIVDEDDEFGIYFEGKLANLFKSAGIFAAIGVLLSLLGSGLNVFPLIIGFIIFILLVVSGFVSTNVSFPVYFTNLRNNIEREIQAKIK